MTDGESSWTPGALSRPSIRVSSRRRSSPNRKAQRVHGRLTCRIASRRFGAQPPEALGQPPAEQVGVGQPVVLPGELVLDRPVHVLERLGQRRPTLSSIVSRHPAASRELGGAGEAPACRSCVRSSRLVVRRLGAATAPSGTRRLRPPAAGRAAGLDGSSAAHFGRGRGPSYAVQARPRGPGGHRRIGRRHGA